MEQQNRTRVGAVIEFVDYLRGDDDLTKGIAFTKLKSKTCKKERLQALSECIDALAAGDHKQLMEAYVAYAKENRGKASSERLVAQSCWLDVKVNRADDHRLCLLRTEGKVFKSLSDHDYVPTEKRGNAGVAARPARCGASKQRRNRRSAARFAGLCWRRCCRMGSTRCGGKRRTQRSQISRPGRGGGCNKS